MDSITATWTETHEVTIKPEALIAAFQEHAPDKMIEALMEKITNEAADDMETYGPLLLALREGHDSLTDINDVDVSETYVPTPRVTAPEPAPAA